MPSFPEPENPQLPIRWVPHCVDNSASPGADLDTPPRDAAGRRINRPGARPAVPGRPMTRYPPLFRVPEPLAESPRYLIDTRAAAACRMEMGPRPRDRVDLIRK